MVFSHSLGARDIDLDDSWDVIVLGGGPSGCAAAAAAAREGAKTLLLEATGSLGGMGTSGLVPAWAPFSDGERIIYGGLAQNVFTRLKHMMPGVKKDETHWVAIDSERLKRIYDDLMIEYDVSVLFNSTCVDIDAVEGQVSAIIVANKAGLSAYGAKVFVDCSGDGDLAAGAGAAYEKGTAGENELQPVSLCFVITNVDITALHKGPSLKPRDPESIIHAIVKSEKYPLIVDPHFQHKVIGPGTVGFNAGHIWHTDGTKPLDVSKAMIQGRQIACSYRQAFADLFPEAFAESFIIHTAPSLGVRETRRIIGDYILNIDDYLACRTFNDEIGRNCFYIDIHHSQQERAEEKEGRFDWHDRCAFYEKGESHGIPYRCLTPKGLKNALVAGRCISCDRHVQGSIRVMPPCLVTGEAAGCAAGLASMSDITNVHDMNVDKLRDTLKSHGAYLPTINNVENEIIP